MEEPRVDPIYAAVPFVDNDEAYAGKRQPQEVPLSSSTSKVAQEDIIVITDYDQHTTESSVGVILDTKEKHVVESVHRRKRTRTGNFFVVESEMPSGSRDRARMVESDDIIIISDDESTVSIILEPKGKQVVELETDLPSSSRDGARMVSCGICLEEKVTSDFFEIGVCGHEFCEECVGRYVAAKVEENVGSIGCPDVGCRAMMEMERCVGLLRPEVFERWGMALCQAMVGDRFYCPYNDCSAMMMVEDDSGEVIRASECPHCNRLFCAQCRVAWHGEIECSELQALGEGERSKEDLLLRNMVKKSKWQRCPKCGYYIEKIDGCDLIKCRCGHEFCYLCAAPRWAEHDIPKHRRYYNPHLFE